MAVAKLMSRMTMAQRWHVRFPVAVWAHASGQRFLKPAELVVRHMGARVGGGLPCLPPELAPMPRASALGRPERANTLQQLLFELLVLDALLQLKVHLQRVEERVVLRHWRRAGV